LSTVDILNEQTPIDPRVPFARNHDFELQTHARILIVEDDEILGDALSSVLAGRGYELHVVHTSAAAEQILSRRPFDVVISDILLPGKSGLALARSIRAKDRDQPVILMTGDAALEHAVGAVEVGAFRFMLKPVNAIALEEVVGEALRERRRAMRARRVLETHPVATTDDLIELETAIDSIWMAYQPIVSWSRRRVVGREALLRSTHPALGDPGKILGAARKLDQMKAVSRAIRARIAATLASSPGRDVIFINVCAEDLEDETFLDDRDPLSRFAWRTVLELSEDARLERIAGLRERMAALRARRLRFALDDLGAGYAGLNNLALLKPEIVKLDMQLTREVDSDVGKQEIVRSMVSLCKRTSTILIAEGIETIAERDTLVGLGCDLFQGYLFARPQADIDSPVHW
jgi:EAL domain-containing protein (putative c-di-GMP-specific phosphodiesterase class I)